LSGTVASDMCTLTVLFEFGLLTVVTDCQILYQIVSQLYTSCEITYKRVSWPLVHNFLWIVCKYRLLLSYGSARLFIR
jgi:hypothetical protein